MKRSKILIVDDREANLIALEKILSVFDIDIIRASSGNEALQELIEHKFALVLMDVQMPDMDGFEIVNIMRDDSTLENTPVIFISAIYRDEIHSVKGIESGAVDFIVKPIIPEVLIGKTRVFLDLYEDKKKLNELNIELSRTQTAYIKAQKIGKMGNFSLNFDDNKIICSDEFYIIHDLEITDFLGLDKYKEIIYPTDLDLFSSFIDISENSKTKGFITYRILDSQKNIKWIRLEREIEFDSRDISIRSFGIIQDVTNETISKKALHRELLVNKTLAKIANKLILPQLNIIDLAKDILDISKNLTSSSDGYVLDIDIRRGIQHCHVQTSRFNKDELNTKTGEYLFSLSDPMLLNTYSDESVLSVLASGKRQLLNIIIVPVFYNKEIVGQISVANSDTEYKEKDLEIISKIGTLYAVAINRLREEENHIKMEKKIRQTEKMQAIGQLVGGIAHDFNNAFCGIVSAAQLLNSPLRNLDEKSKNYVKMILTASNRASDLIQKLLTFGRKSYSRFELVDLSDVLDQTLEQIYTTFNRNIIISDIRKATKYIVTGNFTDLESVIINICVNAAQEMENGGNLELLTENIVLDQNYCHESIFNISPGTYLCISIRDTGSGIPLENLKKIFEPFFTTKEQGKGTGLGLAVVYGTVEVHHGEISVVSLENEGSTFKLLLPCADEDLINL